MRPMTSAGPVSPSMSRSRAGACLGPLHSLHGAWMSLLGTQQSYQPANVTLRCLPGIWPALLWLQVCGVSDSLADSTRGQQDAKNSSNNAAYAHPHAAFASKGWADATTRPVVHV